LMHRKHRAEALFLGKGRQLTGTRGV